MKGIGRLASNSSCSNGVYKQTLFSSSSAFSTSSGGRGGGRGRGSGPPNPPPISQAPGKTATDDADNESASFLPPAGRGHGRGKPVSSTPIFPSFPSWMSPSNATSAGRGRIQQPDSPQREQQPSTVRPKKPIFFCREEDDESNENEQFNGAGKDTNVGKIPLNVSSGLTGAGRGKTLEKSVSDSRVGEENRHVRAARGGIRRAAPAERTPPRRDASPRGQQLSREEATKKAVEILSRGRDSEGGRGRGGRGGRGRGRGMQARRGRGRGRGQISDLEDDYTSGLYLGDSADGERLAKRLGEVNMNKLVEGFDEMGERVLPSPMHEAYLDALDTNYLIECEPEYLMEEFGTNPDIDDTPPIPLREALEKMKPFLMAYEGIQNQEEWEEIIEETMKRVPLMKQIVDQYSGPDRVTAKQQQQELERVASTLPENVPSSVKRFTDRAVLSLQSNPGWGWDKKCQFMDKLVWEVSQQY